MPVKSDEFHSKIVDHPGLGRTPVFLGLISVSSEFQ